MPALERGIDRQLFERLKQGDYTFVVAPRQVGKSSLLHRTARRLEAAGTRVITVDLQSIGVGADDTKEVAESRWYQSLANAIARPLELEAERKAFFTEHRELTPVAAWTAFVRDIVLERITVPIVLMIDEVDRTRMVPFDRNEFFGALRAMLNGKGTDPRWLRLTLCLCGVTAPRDFITDPTAIPIDLPAGLIRVPDLSRAELVAFTEGLSNIAGNPKLMLDAVYAWTNGQPAMTQKLCAVLLGATDGNGSEHERVDQAVQAAFFGDGRLNDALLMDVEHRFPQSGLPDDAIAVYQSVRANKPEVPVRADDAAQMRLVLSGLAAANGEHLRVRNRIYATAFDDDWVMRRIEERPIAIAMGRWIAAERRDEHLLTGSELAKVEGWASGRELNSEEREYLEKSRRSWDAAERSGVERERDLERRRARKIGCGQWQLQ